MRSVGGPAGISDGPARYHLNVETDDAEAEVARLIALHAGRVAERRTRVVLRDRAGLVFDVVLAKSSCFAEHLAWSTTTCGTD